MADRVQEYMTDCGFALSANKTQFLLFNYYCFYKHSISIKIDGMEIKPTTEGRYLGVYFKSNGSGVAHVKNNIAKAKKAINLIKSLKNAPWAISPKI